ncbi:hypothetical protein, unlikely [Trypanosoma brucei gambiense DAL972]|uniref:Uncharacterized protein n=1 Tax=Trypanosoma brucei gambiense (strain MHOM/CI/86/DAL972) TaxID=679716 RepID=D0A942_TRYB9|nr:hypothetical protein, unlikely [Trypanosoma brucei gambiense DAL972]CBH18193.1 hypothetical protein, unlikely [Trypanosoma brucei gambiense DAL972]|eukprot:XP_011780457.1 hypothetical protein, unlikely [Trypanosoma brucei gambiense DAL972]
MGSSVPTAVRPVSPLIRMSLWMHICVRVYLSDFCNSFMFLRIFFVEGEGKEGEGRGTGRSVRKADGVRTGTCRFFFPLLRDWYELHSLCHAAHSTLFLFFLFFSSLTLNYWFHRIKSVNGMDVVLLRNVETSG